MFGRTHKGRYLIETFIKEGSNNIVYKGTDLEEDIDIAVKTLKSGDLTVEEINKAIELFSKDIEFYNTLEGSNFAKCYDFFYEMGNYYLVMEWVEGRTLLDILNDKGVFSESEALRIMYKIAEFLAYIQEWEQAKIFKEIKPSNIVIDSEDRLRVVDVGTARILAGHKFKDKNTKDNPGYLPPETFEKSAQKDISAEVYSVGATIYHLVTGQDPAQFRFNFPHPSKFNPGLSEKFCNLIMDCLKPKNKRIRDPHQLMKRVSQDYLKLPKLTHVLVSIPIMLFLSFLLNNSSLKIYPLFLSRYFDAPYLLGTSGCFTVFLFFAIMFGVIWIIISNASERSPVLFASFFTILAITFFTLLVNSYLAGQYEFYLGGCRSNCKNIGEALNRYAENNRGKYPTRLNELVPGYLKSIPVCSIAKKDTYSSSYQVSDDKERFTVFCKGKNHAEYLRFPLPENWPQYRSKDGLKESPFDNL
jgi:serine/threonine protein kinase